MPADIGLRVQNLAVQVAGLHGVLVHNPQTADPSCSQIDGGGAAQAPGTNYKGRGAAETILRCRRIALWIKCNVLFSVEAASTFAFKPEQGLHGPS